MAAQPKTNQPTEEPYPGQRTGLPPTGRGSLASWGSRIGAVLIDWGACMITAIALFGTEVMTGSDWRSWMILATFFVQSTVLTWLAGGSFGQLICRIAVYRLGAGGLGPLRALVRSALLCLVLPALVIGIDRRGLHDMAAGTVVINRR